MTNTLHATLTRTASGAPLVSLDGLPSDGADLTPVQLRALAATLERIAVDAEARPTAGKHHMSKRADYPVRNA